MANTKDFDPRTLIEDPVQLGKTVDGAHAAALKLQESLHRQRLAAAQRRLEIARLEGDEVAIARETARIETRSVRLDVAETQFALANIVPPLADGKTAQIAVAVLGETDAPPLCIAVLGPNGDSLAEAKINDTGGALFSFETAQKGIRLQAFDGKSRVLYRDAESFDAPLGEVTGRVIRLTALVEPCAQVPASITMPDLTGQTEAVACAILFRLGVRDIKTSEKPDDGPAGLVIGQGPAAGAVLDPDKGASLVISVKGGDGRPLLTMPSFIGKQIADVEAAATELKLKLSVKRMETAAHNEGEVISQDPEAGTTLTPPFAATVTVAVEPAAPSPETLIVPDFVGLTSERASIVAKEMDIKLDASHVASGRPKDEVIKQRPSAGTEAPRPVTVMIVISLGEEAAEQVQIPDIVGMPITRVVKIAKELNLDLKISEVDGNGEPGTVLRQVPEADTFVTLPTTLSVYVQSATTPSDEGSRFTERLVAAAKMDNRFDNLEIAPGRLAELLFEAGATSVDGTERLIAMDNATLTERLGLRNRSTAVSLRSILKGALEQLSR
jgi:beta-lactam-binding protein with PASTA domain